MNVVAPTSFALSIAAVLRGAEGAKLAAVLKGASCMPLDRNPAPEFSTGPMYGYWTVVHVGNVPVQQTYDLVPTNPAAHSKRWNANDPVYRVFHTKLLLQYIRLFVANTSFLNSGTCCQFCWVYRHPCYLQCYASPACIHIRMCTYSRAQISPVRCWCCSVPAPQRAEAHSPRVWRHS